MKILSQLQWIGKYLWISIWGFNLRKKIFLRMLLREANQKWFGLSEKSFIGLCNDLSWEITERYAEMKNVRVTTFGFFQEEAVRREGKKGERRKMIPVGVLEIKEMTNDTYRVTLFDEKDNILLTYQRKVSPSEIEKLIWKN